METKFTKGEWEVKHSLSKEAFNVVGTRIGERYKIARCPYILTDFSEEYNQHEKDEAEANAKLIAAAPEMFDMLLRAVREIDHLKYEYKDVGHSVIFLRECEKLIKKITE